MEGKICGKCGFVIDFSGFHKDKTHSDGYRSTCKKCIYNYQKERNILKNPPKTPKLSNEEYQRQYYQNNKEKLKIKSKDWYNNNLDKVKITKDNYKPKKRILDKIYREKNKEIRNNKEKIRRQNDPLYKLTTNIRRLVLKSFKDGNFGKTSKTANILGCSFEEFKQHIESQWEEWMNWDNYGLYNGTINYGWDMDHVIPLSSALSEEDIISLSHHTNIQPLCSYTNRYIKKDN